MSDRRDHDHSNEISKWARLIQIDIWSWVAGVERSDPPATHNFNSDRVLARDPRATHHHSEYD